MTVINMVWYSQGIGYMFCDSDGIVWYSQGEGYMCDSDGMVI